MTLPVQPYKGTRDFYPEDKRIQKYMFGKLRDVVAKFGYQEYDAPLLEPAELFLAKSGEEIVDEQLYVFEDKGGRKVAIRPEMTPSISRMVAARRQELAYPLRWYSIPNLWRYERPQRGRLREHWQLNVDIFGVADISADHEVILIADEIMKAFKAPAGSYSIRLSSRKLLDYFFRQQLGIDQDATMEAAKLIDRYRKIERAEFESQMPEVIDDPTHQQKLLEILNINNIEDLPDDLKSHESVQQLSELFDLLSSSDVGAAVFDFSVVRGMDYYNDIVFEVFDEHPLNNRSLFGGGRYDGLVELFGVAPLPVVGFGMGDVTLQNFLADHKLLPELKSEVDATAILIGEVYEKAQPTLAELRKSGLNLAVDASERRLDVKIKSVAKSGVKYAIFIGEEEIGSGQFKLKDLTSGQEEQTSIDQIITTLKK